MMWKAAIVVFAALVAVGLGSLVGAPKIIDINDERAQNALRFAVVEHNKGTNDIYVREVEEVQQIKRQVSHFLLLYIQKNTFLVSDQPHINGWQCFICNTETWHDSVGQGLTHKSLRPTP